MDTTMNVQDEIKLTRDSMVKYFGIPCKIYAILATICALGAALLCAVSLILYLIEGGIFKFFKDMFSQEGLILIVSTFGGFAFSRLLWSQYKKALNFGENCKCAENAVSESDREELRNLTVSFLSYAPKSIKSWKVTWIVVVLIGVLTSIFAMINTESNFLMGLCMFIMLLLASVWVGAGLSLCFLGIHKLWQLIRRNGVIIGGGWIIVALIIMIAWLLLIIFSITTIYHIIRDVTKMHKIVERMSAQN